MPRKSQVRYYASRSAYYTKIQGHQFKLAVGPDDFPNGPTYLAAMGEYRKLIEQGKLDTAGDSNTVRVIFNAYLDACVNKKRSSTMDNKKRMLGLFVAKFGNYTASVIKPFHAQQIIKEMSQQRKLVNKSLSWSDGTVIVFISQLKAAFNWALKNELITRNPLINLEKPSARCLSRERLVTVEEHKTVLALLDHKRSQTVRRLIIALENCGARPGELANARVGDFNKSLGAICYYGDDKRRIDEFAHKTSGKDKDRVIYLTGEALCMVREICEKKKNRDFLFPNNRGSKHERRTMDSYFARIREKTGFTHYIPYAYRHSLITKLLEKGCSVEKVAEVMGNTPATIHKHYNHLCRSHAILREMLESI